ncbi:zinc carboxypeptidase-like [Cloeon dipterum]|uniref:zinc carboxypeptidase-like n=1 Tax=Cloeon dipterum TaxID=197152 RepID=UPI00321F968F
MLWSVYLLVVCCAATTLAYKSYEGYHVIRTKELQSIDEVKNVLPLTKLNEYNFFINPRIGSVAEILVGPEQTEHLQNTLTTLGLAPTVVVENFEKELRKEREQIEVSSLQRNSLPSLRYLNFDEIMEYIELVATTHPEIATIINIGNSWEGRPLRVLKLSNGPGKKAIFLESLIHANEWVGPPTVLHAINELTSNLLENQALLDANDWYFLPVANPDGYVYSWTEDRIWRKTRRPNNDSDCVGTDPNRNFDYKWQDGNKDMCSGSYHGSMPYSEPECEAIAKFILDHKEITFYLAVHSYGQFILLPWAAENHQHEHNAVKSVAEDAKQAIAAVNGTQYKITYAHEAFPYFAHGTSYDWAYAKAGIRLSYTIELPPGDEKYDRQFLIVDSKQLPLINAECWEAYKAFALHLPKTRREEESEDEDENSTAEITTMG